MQRLAVSVSEPTSALTALQLVTYWVTSWIDVDDWLSLAATAFRNP